MSSTGLAKKLAEVTAATGWIEKRGTAPEKIGGYKFAMAVDIYDAVRKELSSRNIAQTVSINGFQHDAKGDSILTTVTGDLTFIDGDTGEVISVPFVGVGMDRGDKSVYKAITGGVRDALKANFLLPTGDDPESDAPEASSEKPAKAEVRSSSSAPVPPKAEKAVSESAGLTDAQRGKFMARLKERGLESAGQRKAFLVLLLQKQSTKQMTSADLDKALKELEDEKSQVVDNALAVA